MSSQFYYSTLRCKLYIIFICHISLGFSFLSKTFQRVEDIPTLEVSHVMLFDFLETYIQVSDVPQATWDKLTRHGNYEIKAT